MAFIKTWAFLHTEKIKCFCLPLSHGWLEHIGASQTSLHSLPPVCFKLGPPAVHVLPLSIFRHRSDTLLFHWLSYSPTSPRIPCVRRYICLGLKATCAISEHIVWSRKILSEFLSKSLLLWSVCRNHHGLLIPQLSACSCNKLFYGPFWILET